MEDIAVELFKLGDQEHKGFIVKRDMQRLQSKVSLPPEQLEAVFESLDSSHNGYLTLDQFLSRVNHLGNGDESDRQSDSEQDLEIQRLLGLNVLHKSGELMCEVRGIVGSEQTWHQLLAALFSDLNQLLRQISQLEETLSTRDHQHQEELRRLYEELESQLSDERDRLHKQLQQREAVWRAELATQLSARDQQISELTEQRDELQERLHQTQAELSHRRSSPAQLKTPQEGHPLQKLGEEQSRRRALLQAESSYADGFCHAQQLALLQEEGLVKQLKLLQKMQETLRPGYQDKKLRKFSFDDL